MDRMVLNINITTKGVLWNTIGNVMVSAATFIFSIVIARVQGAYAVGLYSIALAVVNLVSTIGLYNMRAYQITDINKMYSFKEYKLSRIITVGIMLLIMFIVLLVGNYSNEIKGIIFLLTINEGINALSDVYQGMFQLEGELDKAGKTKVIRYSIYILGFTVTLMVTKVLIFSFIIMVMINSVLFSLYDLKIGGIYRNTDIEVKLKNVRKLLYRCFPLFLSTFFMMYYLNAPKYAINIFMDEYSQGVYNILYMLTFVLNLFAIFFVQPLLPYLASEWKKEDKKKFMQIIHFLIALILILIILAELIVESIGIPILSYLYGINLKTYENIFRLLLIVGGIQAIVGILQNILVLMRQQGMMLLGTGITCIIIYFVANTLVEGYGLWGAAMASLIGSSILLVIFYILFWIYTKIIYRKR